MGIRNPRPRSPAESWHIERHPHPGHARAHASSCSPRASRPRRRARRRHARHGRPRRGLPRALPRTSRSSASTATPTRSAIAARAPRAVRRPRPLRAHGLRRHRRGARSSQGFHEVAGRALRPRRLVAAARPGRARVLLLEGRAARHAHGRHDAGCTAADVIAEYARGRAAPHLPATTARRSSRRATPAAIVARPAERADHALRPSSSTIITGGDAGRRAASGPPGQARLPGAAHRGQPGAVGAASGRSPPRSTPSPSAAASSCWPTSRSRTASSSGRSQAASSSTAPAGLPMELPEHRPEFKLLVRGAELASDDEKAENPRATPVRLRAAERVRRPS